MLGDGDFVGCVLARVNSRAYRFWIRGQCEYNGKASHR